MAIERVIIQNFKGLENTELTFRRGLNIIVGDNETGKSTVLEAINLALTRQLKRRDASYELHPHLFSKKVVSRYIDKLRAREVCAPPRILIELYFFDDDHLSIYKGTNNTLRSNCPGVSLTIDLNDEFSEEYAEYISDPERISAVPIEFYHIDWRDFADERLTNRTKPLRPALIDPSSLTNPYAANRYVVELARDFLTHKQQADLALSYRHLREIFKEDGNVKKINHALSEKKGEISERDLTVALDLSTKHGWENSVSPHLDDLPLSLSGKGEQTSIKVKLALAATESCEILLIEEPETHQSHIKLNRLISYISEKSAGKQIITTTHSSFVLNKLGVDSTIMFDGRTGTRINDLPDETRRYFMKLPGHDTLRMVLARRTILVEGPSDELVVQKAYAQKKGRTPLEDEVEVISVNALAFKRFLDIAALMGLNVAVVTDNDSAPERVAVKYSGYSKFPNISIFYSEDASLPTLEPQIADVNGLAKMSRIIGRKFSDNESLLAFMKANKSEVALALFESNETINVPDYIDRAIE